MSETTAKYKVKRTDIDSWLQELIQALNDLEKPIANLNRLLTVEHPGPTFLKHEYETALKVCNLCYLDPKVDGLRILLQHLRYVQKKSEAT